MVGVVLRGQALTGGLEVREVLLGPPVSQPPVGIEQRALVIEAVADLMTEVAPMRAVVEHWVAAGSK